MNIDITLACILLVLSNQVFSGQVEFNGKIYETKIESEFFLDCGSFNLEKRTTRFLYSSFPETQIPLEISHKHKSRPYVISQEVIYTSGSIEKIIDSDLFLPSYSRIDPTRSYLISESQCVGPNTVIFGFWGGGNCSSVCDAKAIVEFTSLGEIKMVRGLSNEEFSEYN